MDMARATLAMWYGRMKIGYIRVSSKEQNLDRQISAMHEHDVKMLYADKESGKDFERKEYKKMVARIKEGDILYIKSIDRLGRSYKDIIEQWRIITKVKKADIVVLDMPLLDTRIGKDLMGTFLSDIVLTVLSYVAENERLNIRQRQKEGIAVAKAKGVKFGRPQKTLPENFEQVAGLYRAGHISLTQAAKACNMPLTTFRYRAKTWRNG